MNALVIPVTLSQPQAPIDTGIVTPFEQGDRMQPQPDKIIGTYNITIDAVDLGLIVSQLTAGVIAIVDPPPTVLHST